MKKILSTVGAVLFSTALTAAPCTTSEAKNTLVAWGNTLSKLKPAESASAQYVPNATLMATFSKDVRATQKDREDYFKYFIGTNKSMKVNFDTMNIVQQPGSTVTGGTYTFSIVDGSNTPITAVARYTYVLEKIGGACKIVSHHSSLTPEITMD